MAVQNVRRQEPAEACSSADATRERHQEPATFDELVCKGRACLQAKDFEQAIVYYERARQLQPDALAVQLTLCLALQRLDRNDEAERVLKAAEEVHKGCKQPFMLALFSSFQPTRRSLREWLSLIASSTCWLARNRYHFTELVYNFHNRGGKGKSIFVQNGEVEKTPHEMLKL